MDLKASSQSSESIAGRAAVIVGAAGGIGQAITARLGQAGCRLALVDADRAALDRLIRDLELKEAAAAWNIDITDRAQVDHMSAEIERRFGGPDILVNAAGINTPRRTLEDLRTEDWERVVAVNLNGVFHCTHALLPLMRKREGGVVVTIVSTASRRASPGAGTHYCATKRALLSLTESINIEQGRYGIRACAISPGEVDTALVDQRPQRPSAEHRAAMLRAQDVAEAVYYVLTRPARVTVSEIVMWPTAQISGVYEI